jgi:hypothetical protein
VGQRFSIIHVLKSGVTTTFDIGGAGGEPERYVDMIDQVGIRCVAGPSYKTSVSFTTKMAVWNTTGTTSAAARV